MSVADLIATLKSTQQQLVKALQDEYFCDDLSPPPEAFGWSEEVRRDFMESGGENMPVSEKPASPPADVSDPVVTAPAPPPPPPPPVDPSAARGRPIILCLGDSLTEFGSHVINLPTADLGGASCGLKVASAATVSPAATEFLRSTETDNPGVEHGPGWIALMARDYAWRTTADVLNRGYSGMNSSLLLADLPEILSTIRTIDVAIVTVHIGANDAVTDGEATYVPKEKYGENLTAIIKMLKEYTPNAKIVLLGPPPVDEKMWQETSKKMTGGRKDGRQRSHERNLAYSQVAGQAAKAGGVAFLDMCHKLKYEFGGMMMEMQNPHRDGLHYTQAVNIFLYRKLMGLIGDEWGMSPSKLPRHRPAQLNAFYGPQLADVDGMMLKYIKGKVKHRSDV